MSEKLCLQWTDFKDNISSAFGELRDDKEFTDVTLVCEDGQQMEAQKLSWLLQVQFLGDSSRRANIPILCNSSEGFSQKI